MPLITCPKCGCEYSSYRSVCPTCSSYSDTTLHTSSLVKDTNKCVEETSARNQFNIQTLKKYGIAIDENNKKIRIGHKTILFRDIIDYNFIDMSFISSDGNGSISTQTKTSTGSMLGRSVLGAVVAGPAGALIGGATASKTSSSTIKTQGVFTTQVYELQIVVNDLQDPVIRFVFDNASEPNIIIAYLKVILYRR